MNQTLIKQNLKIYRVKIEFMDRIIKQIPAFINFSYQKL